MTETKGGLNPNAGPTMVIVNLAQAKANLEELLDQVEHGEEVVVTRHGRAIARIIPTPRKTSPLPFDDTAASVASAT